MIQTFTQKSKLKKMLFRKKKKIRERAQKPTCFIKNFNK